MALQDLEVNVGGTSFKGIYVAVLLSFGSTLAGGIWTASEFFNRLEGQEQAVQASVQKADALASEFDNLAQKTNESLQAYQVTISNVQQALTDNDVQGLQGKLAELGTNLTAIMEAQKELLDMRDRVSAVEKNTGEAVVKVEARIESLKDVNDRVKRLQKEVDDLWEGLDSVANPLG